MNQFNHLSASHRTVKWKEFHLQSIDILEWTMQNIVTKLKTRYLENLSLLFKSVLLNVSVFFPKFVKIARNIKCLRLLFKKIGRFSPNMLDIEISHLCTALFETGGLVFGRWCTPIIYVSWSVHTLRYLLSLTLIFVFFVLAAIWVANTNYAICISISTLAQNREKENQSSSLSFLFVNEIWKYYVSTHRTLKKILLYAIK